MKYVEFLLVLLMASFVVVSSQQASAGCQCRDGRDGQPGRDGRDGRDMCANSMANAQINHIQRPRPSIHLDGTSHTNADFKAGTNLDIWSSSPPVGHITGGMLYNKGVITVPIEGLYFVYCQIYYTSVKGRHSIILNNRLVTLAEMKSGVGSSKYSGLTLKLNAGDKLSCQLHAYGSKVYQGSGHSYFGAMIQ